MRKKLTGKALNLARKNAKNFQGVFVDICNPTKPFKAIWYSNGRKTHLGYFTNAESAALAYNKKAKDLYLTAKQAKKANKWNNVPKS